MNAENGKMFRTALSGYNKDDVNRYILEVDRKNREEKDRLAKDIEDMGKFNVELAAKNEQLTEQNGETAARLAELEAEVARLTQENAAKDEAIRDITKRHDFYKVQTDAQNEALAKAKDEKNALNDRVAVLTAESRSKDEQIKANAEKYAADLETLRKAYEAEITEIRNAARVDDGVAYKLDMYDKISSQIGDILINANRNSDDIITTAKREAEQILKHTRTDASDDAERMRRGISASADTAIREIREEFSGSLGSCVSEIQTCLTELQYETNALLSLLQQKQTDINERLDFYHSNISEAVKARLETLHAETNDIIGRKE